MRVYARTIALTTVLLLVLAGAESPAAAEDSSKASFSPDDTERELWALGFANARVFYDVDDSQTVTVAYQAIPPTAASDPVTTIASVVWRTEQLRFDELVVAHSSGERATRTYAELAEMFGPRPPGFDQVSVREWQESVRTVSQGLMATLLLIGRIIAIAVVVVAVTIAVAGFLIGLAFRPARKRAPPAHSAERW